MELAADMGGSFKFQVSSFKPEQSPKSKAAVRPDFELWTLDGNDYAPLMALVRILVDGYSLLHNWPELAAGAPRHSEAARDALVEMLTQYQDSTGTPVTIFFDGRGARRSKLKNNSGNAVEVLFSNSGRTADDLIERAAHRFQDYGEVLVVTDDFAERDMVSGFGGSVASCANFIRMIHGALVDLQEDLDKHNRAERNSFRSRR
jgi:predicted RNA-binding protein with PIN domain